MKMTTELQFLILTATATLLMWLPYMLARILTRGLTATLANPAPTMPADPAWAERARRAHANAVENLVVFATLVLAAAVMGVSTPATMFAAKLYFVSRLAHYIVYAAGLPVVRTLAFTGGFVATMMVAGALLGF